MYKYIFILLIILFSLEGYAQDNIYQKELTDRFQEFKKTSLAQISTMNWFQVDTFGTITAQIGKRNGEYIAAQDAPEKRDLSFFSEGLKKVNKIRFYGAFDFEYFRADSVANTLNYGYSDEIPYYFYAFRKGSWAGLTYDFSGMADWEVNNRFHIMAGLKYKAQNKWRTVDPRPEIFDQQQSYNLALQYNIHPKHQVVVGGSILLNNYETTVAYVNKDLTDRYSDTGYINHMMYGYGYGLYWTSDRNIFKSSKGKTFQAAYSYQAKKLQSYIQVNYQNVQEDVTQKLTSLEELSNTWFGVVDYSSFDVNAIVRYQYKQHHFYSTLQLKNDEIADDNKKLNIENYNNRKNIYSLTLGDLILKHNKPNWEFNVKFQLQDWYRKDAAQGLIQQYDQYKLSLNAAKFIYLAKEQSLYFQFRGSVTNPTTSYLKLPGIENSFIDRVIKYDYYYHNASVKDIQLKFQYNFPIQKLSSFIGITTNWSMADLPSVKIVPRNFPASNRSLFQVRFGLFL